MIMCIAERVEREKRAVSLFKKERNKDEKTENITNLGQNMTCKSKNLREHLNMLMQNDLLCDTLKC